jgi:fructose transport system ATP-binding protein
MDPASLSVNNARQAVLSAHGVTKRFGSIVALEQADFDLMAREIVGVIGDNGAGKSTLVRALGGALKPDAGEIRIEGAAVRLRSPAEARNAGIEVVHQGLALCTSLSISDNIFLAREWRSRGARGTLFRSLDNAAMHAEARVRIEALGLPSIPDVRQSVETLSGGQRQVIAIARAATFAARVLIMDEPMAALSVREIGRTLDLIRELRTRGMSIALVSHNIQGIFEVADRVHIYQSGRKVATLNAIDHSPADAMDIMSSSKHPCIDSHAH